MKIKIEVDCTPAEARQFFGLPDMAPVHDVVVTELKKQVGENLSTMADPEKLMKLWFSLGGQGLDQIQKMMANAGGVSRSPKSE